MAKKKNTKKLIVSEIADRLLVTFGELKNVEGSRKVKRSLRKASKALAAGLEAAKKKQAVKKVKEIATESDKKTTEKKNSVAVEASSDN